MHYAAPYDNYVNNEYTVCTVTQKTQQELRVFICLPNLEFTIQHVHFKTSFFYHSDYRQKTVLLDM